MLKEIKSAKPSLCDQMPLSRQNQNLVREINKLIADNKRIYAQIGQVDEHFSHKLYQPIKYQGIDTMFLKPLILKQIDHLMQQKEMLLKKREVVAFIKTEQTNKIEQQLCEESNDHFSFLRTVWTKYSSKNQLSLQKMDSVNKIVSMVRNNIKNLALKEQKGVDKQIQQYQRMYVENEVHSKNRETIEKYKMRNQQLESICFNLSESINQKDRRIQELEDELFCAKNMKKQEQNCLLSKASIVDKIEEDIRKSESVKSVATIFGLSQQFKIRIQGCETEIDLKGTTRTLESILQFLKNEPKFQIYENGYNPESGQNSVPYLNLSATMSTNETTASDRYITKTSKFIPMRTQRTSLRKNQTIKTESSLRTSEQSKNMDSLEVDDLGHRRFSRKGEFPLTSDRLRNVEKQESLVV